MFCIYVSHAWGKLKVLQKLAHVKLQRESGSSELPNSVSTTQIPTPAHLFPVSVPFHFIFMKCIHTYVYQYSETKVMHFLFSLLRIDGLYMF
jgi:hypothetical protein